MGRDVSRDKKIPVSSIPLYTVPKKIDFPRYNMKCSGENAILRGIFHVVSCFPLHFMLYLGNLEYFSYSVEEVNLHQICSDE